jgi:phosphoribosyl-ATP pyrophosphohydrolase/phosphoribosyl-AMP cyclohydrolase
MNQLTDWVERLKFDERGLIPAVIQDAASHTVLMLAYMNRESIEKTMETGQTWFWSRSRRELWNKGATSGHVQAVKSVSYDCDGDTLLVEVEQTGNACHTGAYSCFYERVTEAPGGRQPDSISIGESAGTDEIDGDRANRYGILDELIDTIDKRFAERPEGAYTTYLFEKGLDKILKKVGEEATEVIIAGKNEDLSELTSEAGDLIYHLLVLLKQRDIPFSAVLAELEARHGVKDQPNKSK